MRCDAYEAVLAKLDHVRRRGDTAVACCPAHEDKNPSLSVSRGIDGRVLVYCHAGCTFEAIGDALGMPRADFAPSGGGAEAAGNDDLIWESVEAACEHLHPRFGGKLTRYDYLGGDGTLLGVVVRFDYTGGREKVVRPLSPGPGGWRIRAMPEPRRLYNLPQLLATPLDTVIYVVEGEKCVEALVALGSVATTSAGGANASRKSDWSVLAGRTVVILPDKDDPGRAYAKSVAQAARAAGAANVEILELPNIGEGQDVVDWINHMRVAGYDNADIAERLSIMQGTSMGDEEDSAAGKSPDVRVGPVMYCLADIEPQQVQWLWSQWIPLGRFTLLAGNPGCGKSFLTAAMAARVTRGTQWMDGSPCPRGDVILISTEDDPGDTIRPRLEALGADLSRTHIVTTVLRPVGKGEFAERLLTLHDIDALEKCVEQVKACKLVVIDPIGSHLGDIDSYRDSEVRAVLAPLAMLAQKYGVAIVIVAHSRKGLTGSADDSVLGSRAFTGMARSVIHVRVCTQDKERRLVLHGKRNLAPNGTGFAFRIAGSPASIAWEPAPVTLTIEEALAMERAKENNARGPAPDKRDDAADWLCDCLSGGRREVKEIRQQCDEAGHTWRTIQRAATEIGVLRHKRFDGGWSWELPGADAKPGS